MYILPTENYTCRKLLNSEGIFQIKQTYKDYTYQFRAFDEIDNVSTELKVFYVLY